MAETAPFGDLARSIGAIIAPFANRIEAVSLYGSQARGAAHRGSDIDLLISGPIGLLEMLKLGVAFEESDCVFPVDLLHERDLVDPAVRRFILAEARPLFTREDLRVMARSA